MSTAKRFELQERVFGPHACPRCKGRGHHMSLGYGQWDGPGTECYCRSTRHECPDCGGTGWRGGA